MAGFQNRKSTAPPPPPISQLWQMQTTMTAASFSNSDTEARSLSAQDIMNDEEMNKMLAMNGHHLPTDLNVHNRQRSITKEYPIPKPPLHATHAIINEKKHNHFDEILKNNPYQRKNQIRKKIHTKKKRIIRPVNAPLQNPNNDNYTHTNAARPSYYKNKNGQIYNHTITNMTHHRKESKTIDVFLRNRMSEKELQKRQILPANLESNTKQFWDEKEREREKIKSKLTKRLSKSFRPQQTGLYDRGIYLTDPKEEHAAWNRADARRSNSRSLASKFNRRPPPTEVLKRGYIQHDDFRELFDDKYMPQTQPPTPTFTNLDMDKLNVKIAQRPSITEMRRRGLMIDDPMVPAALQNRKRELHRRRASRKLEAFLLNRPAAETLKRRHIMISARQRDEEQKSHDLTKKTLVSHINRDRKRRRKKGKIWIAEGQLLHSKRRESIKISDFLLRRPKAEKLVDRHILPSMPYHGGYDEIRNDFTKDLKQKQKIIDKLFSKTSRADLNELERRGYLPPEFVSSNHINHDFDKAQFEYKRRRKQSRTDLEKQLINRPPMKQLISNHIIDANEVTADDMNAYHQRRKSQKLDFKNNLNAKFESRPDIDHVPYKYFMPHDLAHPADNDDEKVIDTTNLSLDLSKNSHKVNKVSKRGVKRKRIEKTAKSRASLVLEQFLPVRPEIQQLWDKNILPSLPPSPHKMASFNYKKANDAKKNMNMNINANTNSVSPLFGFDTLTQTPSPLAEARDPKEAESPSNYSPITPQTLYIDKRRKRRQDSMAQLELKLLERAPRESLFELGILIMSPAPSPPSLSIIQQIKDEPDFQSIFESERGSNNNVPGMEQNEMQSRKKRKLMNGKTKRKRGRSLVLDQYLGDNLAQKLDAHLYNRPDPRELIARGLVPQYSFSKKSEYSTPGAFAKHRRNMTLELRHKLELKLRARPLLNDLPTKILAVNDMINESVDNERKKTEIEHLLNSVRLSHEKDLEALKERYWSLLMEEKEKYKQLERMTNKREITVRCKLEEMSAECQSLSTLLIVKNTQLAQQEIEFKQRLIRLQQQHEQQYVREQELINKKEPSSSSNLNRKFNEQSERVKQTLVDEINKMEIQHQWKLHNLEDQIGLLKEENLSVKQFSEIEVKKLKLKLQSEVDKERDIATIMVEDLDEEKRSLIQEMEAMKVGYEKKIRIQKEQISQLRQVAQDAVFYGQKAVDSQHVQTSTRTHVDIINEKYVKLKKSKQSLEKKVLFLTQQILNTFKHNLNEEILHKLNLENINE